MFNPQSHKDSQKYLSLTLVDKKVLRQARKEKVEVLRLSPQAVITPLARDLARDYGIELDIVSRESTVEEVQNNIVSLGSDHGGYQLKETLKESLEEWGYEVLDVGTHSERSVDYPDFAFQVALAISEKKAWRGLMIDGVGIGSTMMANKVVGVRCAHCHNLFEIKNSRRHNNANMLCIGGQTVGPALAKEMVKTWLKEPFDGGRHARRVGKIDDLDRGQPPRLPE